jgi:octaprenyl-diphosphate synthase
LAESPDYIEEAMATYGLNLGIAFQLIDDALDYAANEEAMGKRLGDDLEEGKPTLPVIRAMAAGTPEQRRMLRQAIEHGGRERIEEVAAAIASTGAITYTAELARGHARLAKEALSVLEHSAASNALAALADFSVDRSY